MVRVEKVRVCEESNHNLKTVKEIAIVAKKVTNLRSNVTKNGLDVMHSSTNYKNKFVSLSFKNTDCCPSVEGDR